MKKFKGKNLNLIKKRNLALKRSKNLFQKNPLKFLRIKKSQKKKKKKRSFLAPKKKMFQHNKFNQNQKIQLVLLKKEILKSLLILKKKLL